MLTIFLLNTFGYLHIKEDIIKNVLYVIHVIERLLDLSILLFLLCIPNA